MKFGERKRQRPHTAGPDERNSNREFTLETYLINIYLNVKVLKSFFPQGLREYLWREFSSTWWNEDAAFKSWHFDKSLRLCSKNASIHFCLTSAESCDFYLWQHLFASPCLCTFFSVFLCTFAVVLLVDIDWIVFLWILLSVLELLYRYL